MGEFVIIWIYLLLYGEDLIDCKLDKDDIIEYFRVFLVDFFWFIVGFFWFIID